MWQTKRSPLNALTHTLTFPVNLEGRQGGHLCCGGGAWAAETVFIITPPPTKKKPCQKPGAVWPPAAACGRENNNKQWKIRESGGVERSRAPFFLSGWADSCASFWILYANSHLDFCDLRGVILETQGKRYAAPAHGQLERKKKRRKKIAAQHAYNLDLINNLAIT